VTDFTDGKPVEGNALPDFRVHPSPVSRQKAWAEELVILSEASFVGLFAADMTPKLSGRFLEPGFRTATSSSGHYMCRKKPAEAGVS